MLEILNIIKFTPFLRFNQAVSDQFKLENLEIQQTVSVESLEVPIKQLLNSFSFSHFIEFLKIDDQLKRLFYEVEAIKGNWSVRELKRQINSATYERIGLSKDKKEMIDSIHKSSEGILPEQIIKDPYILEFTGLESKVKYSENDFDFDGVVRGLHPTDFYFMRILFIGAIAIAPDGIFKC
ncbi:MAG: Cytoplasmic protein [uncultured Sulfurovum sp.]|uniref:Cytoplasmic protein n=1 Tax=uncultured Sulfurovum sp. TaxID=269237 RepID=A0A6S6SPD0_9BACT|nr:MAG: Cytoplasmic protein [uncultured Sulfurovum sp.]